MNNEELRYPIGKFAPQKTYTAEEVKSNISRIEKLPSALEKVIGTLNAKQWATPYRDGGWTARQVVHHMADSHMNAYIRFKWTLTEPTPLIKVYDEKAWAETPETKLDPIISVSLLKTLHVKWIALLTLLTESDLDKEYTRPDKKDPVSLANLIALYAWHGEHHVGHLKIVAGKS
jgi:hypothetical protein